MKRRGSNAGRWGLIAIGLGGSAFFLQNLEFVHAQDIVLSCARAVRNKSLKRKSLRIVRPEDGRCPPKFSPFLLNTDLQGDVGPTGPQGATGASGAIGSTGASFLSPSHTFSGGSGIPLARFAGAGDGRTFFSPISLGPSGNSGAADHTTVSMPVSGSCKLDNLHVRLTSALGTGQSLAWTIVNSGQPTGLACAMVSGQSSCSGSSTNLMIASDALLSVQLDVVDSGDNLPDAATFSFVCK
jgi:hypothetical protein